MSEKINPIPEGYHTVTPSVMFKNSLKAIEFYKEAFSAKELGIFPTPDGKSVMHAVIQIGNSIIMMGDEQFNQMCKSAETIGSSPVNFFVYVPDVDTFFNKAIASGAEKVMPVEDMFWGDRCGTLKDPFGYFWNIATHINNPSMEDIEEGAKTFFDKAAQN